jgi:outer membrane protein assembly factor BamB
MMRGVGMKRRIGLIRIVCLPVIIFSLCFANVFHLKNEIPSSEPESTPRVSETPPPASTLKSGGGVEPMGGLASSPWPMFRHNLQHTGLSPYDTSANPGKLKWSFTTEGYVDSSPAIGSDGTIYVGSTDSKFYAINPDGTQKWNFSSKSDSTSYNFLPSPAIGSDGTIYEGCTNGKLYAFNPDGTQKWNSSIGSGTLSSPAIGSDSTIYIGSDFFPEYGKLYAVNPDGSQKWNFTTGNHVHSSPAVGPDGTIYVGSSDNRLYAINTNGTQKWNFTTWDLILSSPSIGSDGTIYVGSRDRRLYAINPIGTQKWNFTTGSSVHSSPAIGSDGTIYIGSNDRSLYAINPNGTEKWRFSMNYSGVGLNFRSSPAISSDGTIYFGSYDHKLYAINSDGTEKWNFTTGDWIASSPAIGSDGTIYVGSRDLRLYAIGNASLEVNVTATLSTINSASQSAITSHVTFGMNPIQDAIVNISVDCGGLLVPQNGTTDSFGNFTNIFNAPTVTTQMICRITAKANRTGYENGTGYVEIAVNPIPWPKFRHNLQNTGLSPYDTSKNPGKLKWSFSTGAKVYWSSPSIGSDGTIYFGSWDNKFYALYPNGTQKWNFTTGDWIDSSPAIDPDGIIYVGSNDNKLYAINPDGTQRWNFTTSDGVWTSSPTIGSDGTIYIGSEDYKLFAINPNGTEKWNFTTGLVVFSSPVISSDAQ